MKVRVDAVLDNVNVATLASERGPTSQYGAIHDARVALGGERIVWVGPRREAPAFEGAERVDCGGGWLTPGLVDCHTHLVYAGQRVRDFAARASGKSYAQIAAEGGGIASTVRATREASFEALLQVSERRLRTLLEEGVTTVEIKSGYGLTLEAEQRQLEVATELGRRSPVCIRRTFLGAHTVPPEHRGRADDYVDEVCGRMLPALARAGLVDAVDVYCESVGFSLAQCRRVFEAARALGLPVKGHVEQLGEHGGARLVAEYEGLSVDHLEHLRAEDVPCLAERGVVPVLLPGAFYFLRETARPPIEALRRHGLAMAVATDLNPGTSPMASLLLAMNMACVLFGLTPAEALAGVTVHAARALGLADTKGQVRAGWDADLVLWDIEHPDQLSYGIRLVSPRRVWVRGKRVRGGEGFEK